MTSKSNSKYLEAGVDIDKGNAFIDNIKDMVKSTHQRGVVNEIGGFSSLFSLDKDAYENPILVSSTDGVGTKLAVAHLCNKHDTIGIDLVAMCVNDIIVSGAKPLFFLDYLSIGSLDLDIATDVVKGIAEGCKLAGCSLVGGETAEMPGLYQGDDYDLAGFVTGIVDRDLIVDGMDVKPGNTIIGLSSNGLHSNGYSLVRKICFSDHDYQIDDYLDVLDCTLGEELLKPTRIYVQSVLNVLKNYKINGMIHNTGGGFYDNIPRVLPPNARARINSGAWAPPAIFPFLAEKGEVTQNEMFRTFNMGIGFICIVDNQLTDDIMHHFSAVGEHPYIIGEIETREESEPAVQID